jgi:hypothetical protein
MITRRWLLASVAAFAAAPPAVAQMRPGTYRVGLLWSGTAWARQHNPWFRAFVEKLENRGYEKG